MLYPLHRRELDLVSPAEGKLPLPGTGPLITSDMWLVKLPRRGPRDLRGRPGAEVPGVGSWQSRARQLRAATSQALEVPAACRRSWGERRNPTTSCTKGETETKGTLRVGLAWEMAVLSLLPACVCPGLFSHLCMRRQDCLAPSLGVITGIAISVATIIVIRKAGS